MTLSITHLQRLPLRMDFIHTVLTRWGLVGDPLAIEDLGGAYNANWRVQLTFADIVVRVRPPWITPRRLEDIHALQGMLNRLAISTPHLRLSQSGKTFEFIRGRMVEVYDYLPEAADREWSQARWSVSFAHMGRLHTAFNEVDLQPTPPSVCNYAPPSLLRLMLQFTVDSLEKLPISADRKEGLAICREAERVRVLIEVRLEPLRPHLPHQLVHGDFHLDNLLFEGTEVRYTLDFDFTAWRERIFELAYALRAALPQLTENSECTLDSRLVGDWLKTYDDHAATPLTEAEKQALPYQLATASLYFIAEACRNPDPLAQVLREAPYLELAGFLVDYPDALLEGCV